MLPITDLLLLCALLALAGFSAWQAALGLFPGSLPDVLAASLLGMTMLVILSMLLPGTFGLMTRPVVAGTLIILCAVLLMARSHLPALISAPAPVTEPLRLTGWGTALACALLLVIAYRVYEIVQGIQIISYFSDVPFFEIPLLITFIQRHTLWVFDSPYAYYPYNAHLFDGFGLLFTQSMVVLRGMHVLAGLAYPVYGLLLMRLALPRRASGATHWLCGLAFLAAALSVMLTRELYWFVGKSDLTTGVFLLAASYYLLQRWITGHGGHLVLLGAALGLAAGSRLSVVYWPPLFALLHAGYLLRAYGFTPRDAAWRKRMLRLAGCDFLLVAAPAFPFVATWLARAFTYRFGPVDAAHRAYSIANMLILRLSVPPIREELPAWIGWAAIGLAGCLVLLLPVTGRIMRAIRCAGLALVVIGFGPVMATKLFTTSNVGPYATSLGAALLICVGRISTPQIVSKRVFWLAALATLSFLLFAVTPFGAFTATLRAEDYRDLFVLFYRYNPGGFTLFVAALVALTARALQMEPGRDISPPFITLSLNAGATGLGVFAALLMALPPAVSWLVYPVRSPLAWFENYEGQYDAPTAVYRWAELTLHNTSIYVVNLPPLPFYGRQFSNEVSFYQYALRDQPIEPETIMRVVDEQELAYIAIGRMQWHPAGTPRVEHLFHTRKTPEQADAAIRTLEAVYPVVFRDEQAVVFRVR
ncbi:MAG: hypothetical protein IT326_10600 [Anaerolineae bacterium]|nr:hypothetical protein [Anaerolineae bacterium]